MFCCRGSKCLEGGERRERDKGKRTSGQRPRNQELYLHRSGLPTGKVDGKQNSNILNYMDRDNAKLLKSNVKHVTNVQKDIYVRLNGVHRNNGNSKTIGYLQGSYQVIQIPKSQSAVIRQAPKRASISKLNPPTLERVGIRQTEQTRNSMKLSTEFKVSSDDNRTSTPFETAQGGVKLSEDEALAIFENTDTESLSDEQRNALEQLEDTLNNYQTDDDEQPIIVADVLPYGVFEDLKTDPTLTPPVSSDDEPSSRSSSLSNKSVNSRTGIISQNRLSIGSKKNRNSVSFQLPVDHVDKPYTPMQTCAKPKQISIHVTPPAPEPVTQPPAVCISGDSVNIWHTGNTVYVENKHQRRMSGPFKGSFQSLFYRRYNDADLSGYNGSKTYLTPKIMDKVASFESLTDEHVDMKYRGNRGNTALVRRSTIR